MRKLLVVALLVAVTGPARASSDDEADPNARIVVIDPGHGGTNTGTARPGTELVEKRLTLSLGLLLAQELRARGVTVILTRDDDHYVTVRERVRLTNGVKADLFVSLHANASPNPQARGAETYVLDADTYRSDSTSLAARENESLDGISDPASRPDGDDPDLRAILSSLELSRVRQTSARLAGAVQEAMELARGEDPSERPRRRRIRQSSLDVLRGVRAPAVLAEIGYLSHPDDARLITHPAVLARMASRLAEALTTVSLH